MAYTVDTAGAWVDRGSGKGPQQYNRGQGQSNNKYVYIPSAPKNPTPSISTSSGASAPSASPSVTVQQPAYDPAAEYMEALRRQQEQYLQMIREQEEAQRKAREEAYNTAAAQQKSNYDYASGNVNSATNDALREAYINRMLTERNLQQQLTAQGLNGGASETTTASMYNNYANARNQLERERQNQIGSLSNIYQNNMAQLEAQKASGEAAAISDYAPQLANFFASNIPSSVSLVQADTTPTTTNLGYLEYLRRMAEMMGQGG